MQQHLLLTSTSATHTYPSLLCVLFESTSLKPHSPSFSWRLSVAAISCYLKKKSTYVCSFNGSLYQNLMIYKLNNALSSAVISTISISSYARTVAKMKKNQQPLNKNNNNSNNNKTKQRNNNTPLTGMTRPGKNPGGGGDRSSSLPLLATCVSLWQCMKVSEQVRL